MLHAAVHKHYLLVAGRLVSDYVLTAYDCNLVLEIRVCNGDADLILRRPVQRRVVVTLRNYGAEHGTFFPEYLGQFPCVDSAYARHLMLAQPLRQAFYRIVMAELLAVLGDDEAAYINLFGLETRTQAVAVKHFFRDAVVSYQRVGDTQQLTAV